MTCPLLEYRQAADDRAFDEPRAYCLGAERFVQAMRADICNDRYELKHDEHCEIFLAHAGDGDSDSDPVEES